MFWRNRRQYNGDVMAALAANFGIDHRTERRLGGPLAQLEVLDLAVRAKMNAQEAALYLATLFYCGLVKAGEIAEAQQLLPRIFQVGVDGLATGAVDGHHWRRFSDGIAQAHADAHLPHPFDETPGPYSSLCMPEPAEAPAPTEATVTFDDLHADNALAYEQGDVDLAEHLQEFRRLVIAEVGALLRAGTVPKK